MQFIVNGPDIPDALLQAHEEGRVVFFCGAGVSYPAGLPGFGGLVKDIYKLSGTTPLPYEQAALDRFQYDATLDLLERRLPGQRKALRRTLSSALKPNLRLKGATDTHAALLALARDRLGALRLITTNFDRVFEAAAKRNRQKFDVFSAPMLPIPKNSRWDGLVYLHGALPGKPDDDAALNRLVLTSGDFGLAYLTERWAARFVSELFRNYVVCFIGYSINDPVLRYMMDALAADRRLGEVTPQAWAFGDYYAGEEEAKTIEWEAKGVVPILYEVPTGTHDHSALHSTLLAWSKTYRDGVTGKERIVVSHALARPSSSTKQDDFVGRMLWAISDASGRPAQTFAEFNPVPSLDWLVEPFVEERFKQSDLARFSISPRAEPDNKLRFSLIRRPTPYSLAAYMSLVSGGPTGNDWDQVMHFLGVWITRHLNDPRLIIWVAKHGGHLHSRLLFLIERGISDIEKLEADGRTSEIDAIRSNATNAIPDKWMRKLWRVIIQGLAKSHRRDTNLFSWMGRLRREGPSLLVRLEMRELLAPRLTIKESFRLRELAEDSDSPRKLVDWELVLASDYVHSPLKDLLEGELRQQLPALLDDIQGLLEDALELQIELGWGDRRQDRSYWDLPSISPHRQNKHYRDWVLLIELTRECWNVIQDTAPERATCIAKEWFGSPYATFKRLALYAASQSEIITADDWTDWLLSDDRWWLWSLVTRREVLRLLVIKGTDLTVHAKEKLEAAILAGPPRPMFRSDLETSDWEAHLDRSIWLVLAKLESSPVKLGQIAKTKLNALSEKYPNWRLAENERDEFSSWTSGSGDPDFEEGVTTEIAPRRQDELVAWLRKPMPKHSFMHRDNWQDVCEKHLLNSIGALGVLAEEGIWPVERWREALQVWSRGRRVRRAWRVVAPVVAIMPEDTLRTLAHAVSWWLEASSKLVDPNDGLMILLCRRFLRLDLEQGSMTRNGEPMNEPVTEAINHPIGHVTQALVNLWFGREPNDNDGLPEDIGSFFTEICDTGVEIFRHGRVLLASSLIALFRVDRLWTEQRLLPLFYWDAVPIEARSVWEGFLWSPRLYPPLLISLKEAFLRTAANYESLGEHGRQYAAFLTYAALAPIEGFASAEFRDAVAELPQRGLEEAAQALSQALEGAGDQREAYWDNRVVPFWRDVWPKSLQLVTPTIAESLARMAISAGQKFPEALREVENWLCVLEHPDYVVRLLNESGLCVDFPDDALALLVSIVGVQAWVPSDLRNCLTSIAHRNPILSEDHRYRRLWEFVRSRDL